MADLREERDAQPQMGTINYPDGSVLLRPQTITGALRIIALIIVAAGVVIGIYALNNIASTVIFAKATEQKAIEATLANEPNYNFPILTEVVGLDDASIRANLASKAENLYDVPSTNDSSLDIIKLNNGVSGEQAEKLFVKAGRGLSAKQAVDTLFGSWRFDVDRTNGTVMRVRFADFKSGTPEAAISTIMAVQGLGEDTVNDAGLDEAGNTYRSGTVNVNGAVYNWRASAISLHEIYSVGNLPDGSIYVGLRIMPA